MILHRDHDALSPRYFIPTNLLPTYRLDIEYDGTDWHGWQVQPDKPTIQGAVEKAVETVLRRPVRVIASGRTDAGVHATGQVAHLRSESDLDTHRLQVSLNGILPSSIVVTSFRQVPEPFHARFDANERRYRYRIGSLPSALEHRFRWHVRPEPDLELMNEAARLLMGKHDFSAFCRTASETENRVCDIREAAWRRDQRPGDASFVICGDRFLHGMVRAIVGTLVEIGHGKRSPDDLVRVMESLDRRQAGPAAHPRGLVLERVGYPSDP